jgi:hypothetical protein
LKRIFVLSLMIAGCAGFALAGIAAPEIDPSTGASAFILLSGALLVLRSRKRS